MSDRSTRAEKSDRSERAELRRLRRRQRRDRGVTLPELLITIVITGTLVTAMATATMVIINQNDNSEGRVNNARSETAVGIWMPSDLASAEDVDTSPGASPCGTLCPPDVNVSGSNALMLTWHGYIEGDTEAIPTTTVVSYRYVQVGDEWQIIRVECYSVGDGAPDCSQITMLHNVDPPPPGTEYFPGVTSPTWVMLVTLAVDPADPGDGTDVTNGQDPTYYVKNGRRVTVTINGGGDVAGAGGGQDQITLSAGGTNREPDLGTNVVSASPTFAATRSRCGGNFGLMVDTSGSIGGNMSYVRQGIVAFINAFAGTPVRLQVVRFSSTASTLGSGSGWSRYFDMLNESDVAELISLVGGLSSGGSTNWEDAFFRMFHNSDGSVQQVLPSTLILFTDGMPTYNRLNATSASAPAVVHPDDTGLPGASGSSYNQLSWNRANRIIREYEVDLEKFVGVYVGTDVNGQSTWIEQGQGYHLANFERGYHFTWEQGFHLADFERGYRYTYQRANSGLTYEYYSGGRWRSTTRSNYESNNESPGDADGWRARVRGSLGSWRSTSEANYLASNLTEDESDGFRAIVNYSSPYSFWEPVSEAEYNANNWTSDESDGWRANASYSAPFNYWSTVSQSTYNANNTTSDDTDGWRQSTAYSSPFTIWEPTTEALYNANNYSSTDTDGWRATKVYEEPYTFHEGSSSYSRYNRDILKDLVAPGGVVPAIPAGGPYTNAAEATYYELPAWSQFSSAMTSVALAECGGTVTVQTRVGGSAAADPFTYQNSVDLTTATTSSQFRSGTFDFDLAGGVSLDAEITQLNLSSNTHYEPVGWSCTSSGAPYPFTTSPIDGGPWQKISLTVSPNEAISCIQTVRLV